MSGLTPEKLAAAEAYAEAQTEESLTDIAPDGALTFGGIPARALSAADFKIVHRILSGCDKAGIDLSDEDIAVLIIYCLIQTEKDDIKNLWRAALDVESLWETITIEWLSTIGVQQLGQIIVDAAPQLQEFRDIASVVSGSEGGEPGEDLAAIG